MKNLVRIETNKIVLRYMNVSPIMSGPDSYYYTDSPWFHTHANTPDEVMNGMADYAKYDKSWDWLIPVTTKILTSEEIEDYCSEGPFHSSLVEKIICNNIQGAYNDCVDFIEWYNTNKVDK